MIRVATFLRRCVQMSFGLCLVASVPSAQSQTLPDVFTKRSGEKVRTAKDWYERRRPEIINIFEREEFGKHPATELFSFRYRTIEKDRKVLNEKAFRSQVRMSIVNKMGDSITVDLLIYYPAVAKKSRVPVFTLLNYGNHTLVEDILVHPSASKLYQNGEARGSYRHRFPIETIIGNGCAVITSCNGDFIPDDDSLFRKAAQDFYGMAPGSTGAIAFWAWGYSRMIDFALSQSFTDATRIAVVGQSRTGKAALWCAANDQRVNYAFVNESGNSGVKLNFHQAAGAESIAQINKGFPHWFSANYKKYNGKDSVYTLPFDQHWLVACIAPRQVYVGNAKDDHWGDPPGEFIALKEAEKVYQFLGLPTRLPAHMPGANEPTLEGYCGYHLRNGGHDLLMEDWVYFLKFIKP